MNHKTRAAGIISKAFPKTLRLSDGTTVDVSAWHDDLIAAVTKGLRQAAKDAHREAIHSAVNTIGDFRDRTLSEPAAAIIRQAITAVLALEKKGQR